MNILLFGGTGRLSNDTTLLCIEKGYEVYLFNRGNNNNFTSDKIHYLIGDINDENQAKKILEDLKFDVVIDYLTYTLDVLKKRINLIGDITKHYIFISSATVYPVQDRVIDESLSIGNDAWIYSKNKRLCEEYLREKGDSFPFEYSIVRPYVTYDKNRIPFPFISKKSSWNLIYRIEHDLPIVMPGDGEQLVTLTSTIDFAKGIVGLFLNEQAYGEDFNIVGDTRAKWNDVVWVLNSILHKKATIVYVDPEKLAKLVPTMEEELLYDKSYSHIFDNTKIKKVVPEFKTTIDLMEGMRITVDYLKSSRETQKFDKYWNATEDVLCQKFSNKKRKIGLNKYYFYFKAHNRLVSYLRSKLK